MVDVFQELLGLAERPGIERVKYEDDNEEIVEAEIPACKRTIMCAYYTG
jgi:hypothetical protein